MRPFHVFLGILVAAIWGFNFVVRKVAPIDVPPMLLTALRLLFSCLPVLFLAKTAGVRLRDMIAVGLGTLSGSIHLPVCGHEMGMPAGLLAIVMQLQVFITVARSILVLGERLE